MATVEKDFKVKNGLTVALGGNFGGTVTVATPTDNSHAATKQYVDEKPLLVNVQDLAPASATNGQLYYDTTFNRMHVYYNNQWTALASIADAEFLQDHIHDTSIGGNGLLASIFVEAGVYNTQGFLIETGSYNTVLFSQTWDGGVSVDNFS
jgi:hypothetical protein